MDVEALRREIPSLQRLTYMNTGWSGPPPRRVAQALKDRVDYEMEEGPTTAQVHQAGRAVQAEAREAAAKLFSTSVDEVLITRNTTEGLNIVLSGLDWKEDDEIVVCDLDHSSVLVTSQITAQRHGLKVHIVSLEPHDSRDTILEKFEAAFSPRTRLLFVSHVQYTTGLRMPTEGLRQLTADRGVLFMVDGAQTGGHLNLDMPEQGFDFYSIPGQKWVLGYEGVGALYIRQEHIERIHPAHSGGRAAVTTGNPYDFQPIPTTMEKFLGGSASVPLQAAFLEATRFLQEIGIPAIEERNLDLASLLKGKLVEVPGVEVLSPSERRDSSGLVSFAVTGQEPEEVVSQLWEQHQIVVRPVHFPEAVRASLHFFNTEEEVEKLADAVGQIAKS